MNEQAQAFWDSYEQGAKQEMSTGRGGAIAHVKVETGWKAFASGTPNDESWFPAMRADKTEWNTAKKAAQKLCNEGRYPSAGVTIVASKDKYFMYGEKREYEEDRHFFRSEYHELTKHKDDEGNPKGFPILFQALRAAGVTAGFSGWVRLTRVPNPFYADDEDKAWDKAITIISEVFKNPGAAKKAIAAMPKKEVGGVPEGYDAADWEESKPGIMEDLDGYHGMEEENQQALLEAVAGDYNVAVSYITAIADEIVPV